MLGCLVSGIAVSNERGVFVPLHDLANTLAITARAFAALASPPPLPGRNLLEPYENLLLSEKPALPPGAPADGTPQAMMSRVLDMPSDQPASPIFIPTPPTFGPLAPILTQARNVPALIPFQPLPGLMTDLPADTAPATPSGPVPEPTSWALLIAGFATIGWIQRRLARKSARSPA